MLGGLGAGCPFSLCPGFFPHPWSPSQCWAGAGQAIRGPSCPAGALRAEGRQGPVSILVGVELPNDNDAL